MEPYWNMHIPGVLFASNDSPIQNLVLTNSKLKQTKNQSLKCTKKKIKRVTSANAKLKNQKGSLVTIMRYVMLLSFLKKN